MIYGERVKFKRKEKNMTQSDLGKLLGLERESISNIESNKTGIKVETLVKLAEIFDESIYYFLDIDKPRELINVPSIFTNCNDSLDYLSKHSILSDLDLSKLNEDELIDFSNEIQHFIKILSYKYKR